VNLHDGRNAIVTPAGTKGIEMTKEIKLVEDVM
jgi:hypothetical protein